MSIAVEQVDKVFEHRVGADKHRTRAVSNASFVLQPGEILGLVGESGSGKSTLARIVLGLIPPTSGEVFFDGRSLARFGRDDWAAFRRQVQAVFQDPRSALNWRMTIEHIVTEPLLNYRIGDKAERRARAVELLEQVNVSPTMMSRRPTQLSGGQLQRVAIARSLALEPGYLVCDEPLSALDVSVQAGVVNLLLDLQASRNLAMLFISHDLGVVRHLCDRVLVMYRGEIVESAPAAELYGNPSHDYTRSLLGMEAPRTGQDLPEPAEAEPSAGRARSPAESATPPARTAPASGPPVAELEETRGS